MDNTDISVLELLVSDARHTDEELAVMLGIPLAELRERKEKLEKDGVIIGYSAVVNTEKLVGMTAIADYRYPDKNTQTYQKTSVFEKK